MKILFWLVMCGSVAVIVFIIRYVLRKSVERDRAEEVRAAAFIAQMSGASRPAAPPSPAPVQERADPGALEQQKLLFDAGRKAGEAGEPALAIQLYARLLVRFPDTAFATEVRAAAELQKKKIVKT